MTEQLQARLKPFDPKQGHLLRTLCLSSLNGARYEATTPDGRPRIYNVTPTQAEVLREIRQPPDMENGPLAFDVLPESEMAELLRAERDKMIGVAAGAPEVAARAPERFGGDNPVPAVGAAKPKRSGGR